MATRRSARVINRLKESEIIQAIRANSTADDAEADLQSEEEDANDIASDDESDADWEEGSDYSDYASEEINTNPETFIGRDQTKWSSEPIDGRRDPLNTSRYSRYRFNKVLLPPGKHLESVLDCFELIFDDKIIDIIVCHTNSEAKKHEKEWKDIDRVELKGYIGLLIAAGVERSSKRNYQEFFGRMRGLPIFKATMALKRFGSILRYIRFDDKNTRSIRRLQDKFAPIRDVFNLIVHNLKKYYSPSENLTVDEQLVPFRGRCSFKQYIPSKPDKYGMKIFWLCDAKTAYPLNANMYLGRERTGSARQTNIAQTVVSELCQPYYRTGRNITMDNFFTSHELALNLKSNGLTCVGTVRKNKTFIPREFLPNRQRPVGSNLFGFRQFGTLLSHVPKPNKAVLILSTLHFNNETDAKGKSIINLFYNSTKGGVDTLDQLCHAYTVQRKTNRWPHAIFFNMINVVAVAAFVIHRNVSGRTEQPVGSTRKRFLVNLTDQLVYHQIKRRSKIGLRSHNQLNIDLVLGKESSLQITKTGTKIQKSRKRCALCPPSKDRKVKQACLDCHCNVCNEHSVTIMKCRNCAKLPTLNESDSE
ncbi:piggyBac transposable element-derived protein 4 [Topomyia yanbarensis]|uniref:piggyBac transposable element-derived protein 4 n=1 Tax=Topomyia yanbarensis TaxID=2498891 RepID=UPI00273B9056|nr:piggyBac transposable element-derived protein 4 [Topomyia yanbarensis]